MSFDLNKIRNEFPMLSQTVYGKPYIYLDNGATTQKPRIVVDTISNFYLYSNSSIHRGVHFYSDKATIAYENARETVKDFVNAAGSNEIVFTKGTTESINLVAYSFGERFVNEGDEIIVSEMEHHSNIVPWQMLCERKKAVLKVIPFNNDGILLTNKLDDLISPRTKIIAITQVSNSLGTINPVKQIIEKAHKFNIPVLVDGAQAIQHCKVDVKEMDCDFYAFSGHKIYGPTGIGVLYGKDKWLSQMPPYNGGGSMIESVTFEKTTFNQSPFRFEAGTPHIMGAISLAKALDFINEIGKDDIINHENNVMAYATNKLKEIPGLTIYGNSPEKAGSISFLLDGIHHADTGMVVDKMGIAVRTGMHCTQPVMEHFKITGTVRASFAMYNSFEDIDSLANALLKVIKMFR